MTLDEAKQWLRERVKIGAHCPCCNQMAKVYKRSINRKMASMLFCLFKLTQETGEAWHHITKIEGYQGGGDFSKLTYWGLLREKPLDDKEKKKASGIWSITEDGIAFILGKISVPKYSLVYDSIFLGHDGDKMITFRECFKENFDFSALMSRRISSDVSPIQ